MREKEERLQKKSFNLFKIKYFHAMNACASVLKRVVKSIYNLSICLKNLKKKEREYHFYRIRTFPFKFFFFIYNTILVKLLRLESIKISQRKLYLFLSSKQINWL